MLLDFVNAFGCWKTSLLLDLPRDDLPRDDLPREGDLRVGDLGVEDALRGDLLRVGDLSSFPKICGLLSFLCFMAPH